MRVSAEFGHIKRKTRGNGENYKMSFAILLG
jgi:hypothetical protein